METLVLEASKSEILEFNILELKHVTADELSYVFRIKSENIEYGFPVILDKNKNRLRVEIPPLNDVIKGTISEVYSGSLDIVGKEKNFYISPWKRKIKIRSQPELAMELHNGKGELDREVQVELQETFGDGFDEKSNPGSRDLNKNISPVEHTELEIKPDINGADEGLKKIKESIPDLPSWF